MSGSELTFRLLRKGDEQALKDFLYPRLDSSMFLYGNMQQAGLEDRDQQLQGTYAAVLDGQTIAGVVAHYWNNNLILQSENHLARLIELAVSGSGRPVGGLMGLDEQVIKARTILKWKPEDILRDEAQWLYSLRLSELQVPEILRSGSVLGRRARVDDVDLLGGWRSAYLAEALGLEETADMRREAYNSMQNYVNAGHTWIIETDGEPVASSSFNAVVNLSDHESVVQIGGVWTPPKYRSRGYGRAAVAASLLDAQAQVAKKAILFTADDNLPAQKAYLAIGFRRIGTYRLTILNKPTRDFPPKD